MIKPKKQEIFIHSSLYHDNILIKYAASIPVTLHLDKSPNNFMHDALNTITLVLVTNPHARS